MENLLSKSHRVDTARASLVVLFLVYVGVRVWELSRGAGLALTPDSPVYFGMAAHPWLSAELLAGSKPAVVPMLYKLLGGSALAIVLAQSALAAVCWMALAWQAARSMSATAAKLSVGAGVLAISLQSDVLMWDRYALSESVSLAMFAAFVAAWLSYLRGPSARRALAVVAVGVLFGLCREANAYLLVALAGCLVVAAVVVSNLRKSLVAIALAFVLVFAINSKSSSKGAVVQDWGSTPGMGARWVFPLLNVVGQRVLTVDATCRWFQAHGMPVSDSLARAGGKWASSDGLRLYRADDLEGFRAWVLKSGQATYYRYLLTHPAQTLAAPLAHEWELLSPAPGQARPAGFVDVLQQHRTGHAAFVAVLASLLLALALKDRRGIIIAALLGLAYVHALAVWHGDAMEICRHAVGLKVQLRVGMALGLFLGLDLLLALWSDARAVVLGAFESA